MWTIRPATPPKRVGRSAHSDGRSEGRSGSGCGWVGRSGRGLAAEASGWVGRSGWLRVIPKYYYVVHCHDYSSIRTGLVCACSHEPQPNRVYGPTHGTRPVACPAAAVLLAPPGNDPPRMTPPSRPLIVAAWGCGLSAGASWAVSGAPPVGDTGRLGRLLQRWC